MSFRIPHGRISTDLTSSATVGVAQSRGERPYQEDACSVHCLHLPLPALKRNLLDIKGAAGWAPTNLEGFEGEGSRKDENRLKQVAYFAVLDGHGSTYVSHFLRDNLHAIIENSRAEDAAAAIERYRALGGYFKRFRGGAIKHLRKPESDTPPMSLGELLTLAYIKADNEILQDDQSIKSGSVATVAMLHSLDEPFALPFYAASRQVLTLAHLGDTRALLASSTSGRAVRLTDAHHPDSRVESDRLRRTGTGIITDSFGEMRWGGGLANTRGFGDRNYKAMGVTGEPEIIKRLINGPEWSALILMSDGVSDMMTDQEAIDLCRGHTDPTRAARAIVAFAEELGGSDNITAVVVPLPGWGRMGGTDTTLNRREYRMRQLSSQSRRSKRM